MKKESKSEYLRKYKVKQFFKKAWGGIKLAGQYLLFPHMLTSLFILLLAILSFWVSFSLMQSGESFWSSIFSNVAAGLFTGIVICLVGGIKNIAITKVQLKIKWLDKIRELLDNYIQNYPKLFSIHFQKSSEENEKTFEMIYEIGSYANWVNEEILQSSFDKRLLFDPNEYCKKHFDYDAYALSQDFQMLHEQLEMVDFYCPSSKEIRQYFEKVDKHLRHLSREISRERNALEIRLSRIQSTLI